MDMAKPITFRMDDEKVEVLDQLAVAMDRDRSYLLNEAVEDYIYIQQWQLEGIDRAIADADAGKFASDEEVRAAFEAFKTKFRLVKIVWLELAILDLHQVREFIRLDNPSAAEKTGGQIEANILNLARFPDMGRPGRRPQTRELMIPKLPYRIVYRVRGDTVQILRVYQPSGDGRNRFECPGNPGSLGESRCMR